MSCIRVLVVDDSVVVRRLVTDALSADPIIDVVGTAANGKIALTKVAQLAPDVITMDIEMPQMNGIEAVTALRAQGVKTPIIMFSTLTERGATATLDALSAGATDYVTKPANVGSVQEAQASVREQLVPKIRALVPRSIVGGVAAARTAVAGQPSLATRGDAPAGYSSSQIKLYDRGGAPDRPVRAVLIGSSTGGPEALSNLMKGLTQVLPVPVVITQHMPPVFTRQLAARLDRLTPSTVVEATSGLTLTPGNIYIAPGDFHLEFELRTGLVKTHLTKTPPVNFCRPSVDVMFRSAVKAIGGDVLAVVLTGMGSDGRTGCQDVQSAGGRVLAQDEATSVVWGMPGAVATAGLADRVLPIAEMAPTITQILAKSAVKLGGR